MGNRTYRKSHKKCHYLRHNFTEVLLSTEPPDDQSLTLSCRKQQDH